jgi:hypothetical protein
MAISAAVATVAGAAHSIYSGERAAKAQKEAQSKAEANAKAAADAAEQANNKANQKRPNASAISSAIEQAAKGGPSGTMLTGALGVDPSSLQLGKQTLLGL